MYFIIGGDGKEYGPYSEEKIRALLNENRLEPNSRIRGKEGQWTTVEKSDEFSKLSPSHLVPPQTVPPTATATPYPPGHRTKTNGFAIAGLVTGGLSIMCIYPCCGIPFNVFGLIFSCIALSQIKTNPQMEGKGMAIAGLSCSLLSLGIFLVIVLIGAADGFMQSIP